MRKGPFNFSFFWIGCTKGRNGYKSKYFSIYSVEASEKSFHDPAAGAGVSAVAEISISYVD